jgi:hypothetical protein
VSAHFGKIEPPLRNPESTRGFRKII